MSIRRIIFLLSVIATMNISLAGDFVSSSYSTSAMQALRFPIYADNASMAGAVTAFTENLTGLQFNPAVLDALKPATIDFSWAYRFLSLDRRQWGINTGFNAGEFITLGISTENFTAGKIEGRDSLGNTTGNFDYREGLIGITVAGRILWSISLGASAKYLFSRMDGNRGKGMGFDVGMTRWFGEKLCIGISGRHLFSYIWLPDRNRNIVLPEIRGGIAGLLFNNSLTTEFDIVKTAGQPLEILSGFQFNIAGIAFIRGGIGSAVSVSSEGPNFKFPDFSSGAGMRYEGFGFDYAIEFPSSKLGLRHTITLSKDIEP